MAVRVDNSRQPNCRWYSGSGIYRHVWLEKYNENKIKAMNLVEIQVVCAQAFQGSFNLLLDGFLGETTFIEINLGCDNHVLSLDAEILE